MAREGTNGLSVNLSSVGKARSLMQLRGEKLVDCSSSGDTPFVFSRSRAEGEERERARGISLMAKRETDRGRIVDLKQSNRFAFLITVRGA